MFSVDHDSNNLSNDDYMDMSIIVRDSGYRTGYILYAVEFLICAIY